ncbi:hypothetical protein ACKUVQ_15725 [Mycobacterium seoulense]|uniref:hypothetical protein n=1 Tax=Mycobacterium seoulense TaxID=386911 RepID=UPI003CEC86C0
MHSGDTAATSQHYGGGGDADEDLMTLFHEGFDFLSEFALDGCHDGYDITVPIER